MKTTIDALVEALTGEQLADFVPQTATVITGDDGKERGVLMTPTELRQFLAAALAQARAEQAEPFGHWFEDDPEKTAYPGQGFRLGRCLPNYAINIVPLYTTPPAAPVAKLEPLNDREIQDVIDESHKTFRAWSRGIRGQMIMQQDDVKWHLIRAVEAAHNAKLGGAT